ncbi:MAG TPA: TetR/AcrR family transcriptional regulator [Solirubrobacteraceae bacterium]|nr:TetR/AcrR family transcriptional regulator [Solirubrobacteraceae bacterium]
MADRGDRPQRQGRERRPRPAKPRGSTNQRDRLIAAIVAAVGANGYGQARVGDIAKRAGVSRATFYELFNDKQDCFVAAHLEYAPQLRREVQGAIDANAAQPVSAAIGSLVAFAAREPDKFAFLTHHAMLAGPAAGAQRDALFEQLERLLGRATAETPPDRPVPAVPVAMLLSGSVWTLNVRIRRGESFTAQLAAELSAWAALYDAPSPEARRALRDTKPNNAEQPADVTAIAQLAPQPLPRGRHRLPPDVVKRVQRERIIHATASTISAKGYEQSTVADIVAAAGLSREAFYQHFADKHAALIQASRHYFGQVMAVVAAAYFASPERWPERVWRAGVALTGVIAGAPAFAHLTFVDAYAPGTATARQIDELFLGFTIFLEDGYRYRDGTTMLPRTVSEAVVGAIVELTVDMVRKDRARDVVSLMPTAGFTILAPFIGVTDAHAVVGAHRKARTVGDDRS